MSIPINMGNRKDIKAGSILFLDPPARSNGKTFSEATCEFVTPNKKFPELTMRGFPNEGGPKELFLLILNGEGLTQIKLETPKNSENEFLKLAV